MTGFATVETAVEAIKLGATDYLSKPLDFARLEQLLDRHPRRIERRRSVLAIEGDLARRLEFCGMVGRGPVMQELFSMIRRLAPHVRTALVTGETGTGKELVARALHTIGPRRDRRFVTVNCSAVDRDAVRERAVRSRARRIHRRDGEQAGAVRDGRWRHAVPRRNRRAAVVRAGQAPARARDRRDHRVGSLEPRRVNVRVLAATNRDLRAEVAAGRFRSDLYYRLNVVEVKLPPLRERRRTSRI